MALRRAEGIDAGWGGDGLVERIIRSDTLIVGGDVIESSDITGRVLQVIIPKGSMSQVQRAAIEAARERARRAGVELTITEF